LTVLLFEITNSWLMPCRLWQWSFSSQRITFNFCWCVLMTWQ